MARSSSLMLLLALVAIASPASAIPVNGDFGSGLNPATDWTAVGQVTRDNNEALFEDGANGTGGRLYQGVALAPGQYDLSLDFFGGLSRSVPFGTTPDVFFASLYFIDDLATFDVDGGVFDDAAGLFDADRDGAIPLIGSFIPSAKGAGWWTYRVTFTNQWNYVIPFFELIDGNFIGDDSLVRLDNIRIDTPIIPEPATLSLGALGLGLIAAARRRRRLG